MSVVFFFVVQWYISLFCQSFFLHRYSAHGMFKLSLVSERFFWVLTYLSQGPSYLDPKSYAILHRRHHQNSDKEGDPHSPLHSSGPIQMMVKTYREYNEIKKNVNTIPIESNIINSPKWKVMNNITRYNWIWFIIYPIAYFLLNPPHWIFYFLLPFHFFLGPTQGLIVNWFGHKVGYRNFNLKDNSKNTFPQDFFLLGELYQNNHHQYPLSMNFATRWWEIDLTYWLIRLLELCRVVRR